MVKHSPPSLSANTPPHPLPLQRQQQQQHTIKPLTGSHAGLLIVHEFSQDSTYPFHCDKLGYMIQALQAFNTLVKEQLEDYSLIFGEL